MKKVLVLAAVASALEAQAPSTDVYTLSFATGKVVNVTNRPGYDNQPAWVNTGARRSLVWTSQRDGQTDIYQWLVDREGPLRETAESEYSAAELPDGRGFAVIRVELDSTQRLWKFPFAGRPEPVFADIKPVGYFAYLDSVTLALFVLGSPNTLQIADTRTGKGVVVTTNIGRSVQRVPGTRKASFTQRINGKTVLLTVHATSGPDGAFKIDTIAALPDSAEYVVWRDSNKILTGAGSRLMSLALPSKEWTVFASLGPEIRRISRLALNPDGSSLAFVADEPLTKPK